MLRWTHGHSTLTGLALGLLLDRHVFLLALLFAGLGLVAGRFWFYSAVFVEAMRRRVHASRQRRQGPRRPQAARGQTGFPEGY